MKTLFVGCALAALATSNAFAQSTGTVEQENREIVVTGSRTQGVAGIVEPNTSKAKAVLTDRFIQRQTPGQSIDDIINMLPGVSFQNNDPYGASGGTLTIHGFDASRISQTIDGIPLNDTGNYALYSQQQLDPELIEQVNVNLGTTDVDSPTAAATGSTVNYRTRNPFDSFGARIQGSAGDFGFFRIFGTIDTGIIGPFGTKAFFSASQGMNRNPYNRNVKTDRQQFNAKVYQPIGGSGDFISASGNYNKGRNGNFSSIPLRTDPTIISTANVVTGTRVVGVASTNRFPTYKGERTYTPPLCQIAAARPGVVDTPNTCGTLFDNSFNPSDTGSIRVNSRFTITDKLVLTVDPSYQYVKANGGTGAIKANEGVYSRAATGTLAAITTPLIGYIGGQPYFGGVDLNGDGDVIDTPTRNATTGALSNTTQGVEAYAPSQTGTHRLGVIASLRYDFSETQTVRLSYSYDHGRHRQTGPVAGLNVDGSTQQFFPIDNPLRDVNGNIIQKRNRLSYAILNQISGEYSGRFLDDKLSINAGVRAPFFKRKLNNYCVTETGGSFVDCFNGQPASQAAFLAANPAYVAPTSKTFKFNKLLPTAGLVYKITPGVSAFASYNKGYQVPGTDNLYQSLGFSGDQAQPRPETTDNFEGGLRYQTSKLQMQLSGWYTLFKNRLASAYDPTLDVTVYRNLGTVQKYGVDGSVAYRPVPPITLYAFGSYLKSHINNDVLLGRCTTINNGTTITNCPTLTTPVYGATAGKRESGSPVYTFGGRIEGNYGPIQLGIQAKRTGPRYVNDQNLPIFQCPGTLVNQTSCTNPLYQVFGAKTAAYNVVDLDARISLKPLGLNDKSYLQLNVTNLFDKLYVSGFTGGTAATNIPFAYVGPPRAFSGTINFAF